MDRFLRQMGTAMNDFQNDPAADVTKARFQMAQGWDVLTDWSENASQSYRNALYAALFSMLDRTLFTTHFVIPDPEEHGQYFVAVKQDLALKLRLNGTESFDVLFAGAWEDAPGFELGLV
jgi:hypothetical protein